MDAEQSNPRDREVDAYLRTAPTFRLDEEHASTRDAPVRYSRAHRLAITQSLLRDNADAPSNQESGRAARYVTLDLFDDVESVPQCEFAKSRPSAFFDCVISAYLTVYGGFSIDRLIADRRRCSLFVAKCWELGVQASAKELTWALLNARKANQIGPIPCISRFQLPAERMYDFLFASDIALRCVQDSEWRDRSRDVSLDYILCDPALSDQFFAIATELAPGASEFEFRWAAMCIRKNQRRSVRSTPPHFIDQGNTIDLRISSLSRERGFYWLQCNAGPLYVGHAANVRSQVDRLLQIGGARSVFPEWMTAGACGPIRLATASTMETSLSRRETLKSEVCLAHSTLFNTRIQGGHSPRSDGHHSRRSA